MVDLNRSNTLSLRGEIVSIYEKENVRYAKIHYDSGFVDLSLNTINEIYLNDRVVIYSKMQVETIATQTEENNHR